jgi:hypothetical protein
VPTDDDRWEWLLLKDGWCQYEYLERVAICLESKVDRREASRLAQEQVGAGSYAVEAKPPRR